MKAVHKNQPKREQEPEESIVAASKEREAEIAAESKTGRADSSREQETGRIDRKGEPGKIGKSQEADLAKQEEFRNRMQEFVNEWSNESNKKLIKKLRKEDETQVKEFLLDKMKTAMRENDVLMLKNMQLYCEMYQTLYGTEDVRKLSIRLIRLKLWMKN